jgi:prepilin-type N-terminal cleavage/methylation domain-containing protein
MKKNGFTLIEILAAIVIMGIVGAIGVVAISSNIVDARKSTTANLAKQLAESARNMRG